MDEPQNHIYEFGDFRVDTARRLLRKGDGEIVPLTPKVFDTLLYLVEHSGKIIEKDELMREFWTDSIVEENNLSQNISILRRILGEKRGEHRFIATIPGRGFRFVPNVSETEGIRERSRPETPDKFFSRNAIRKPRIWLAAIIGMVIVGLGIMAFDSWQTKPALPVQVKTIAVLPFKPLVLEDRDEALEIGIADTLISRLGNNKEIIVRPLSAVRRYGDLEQDALQAGRDLAVDSVLDGSIQRRGENMRVNIRLVRVADGTLLLAETFDEKFTDIFTVQDAISQRLAAALQIRLGIDAKKRTTQSIEAYEFYVKGRYASNGTREGYERSLDYFQKAIAIDPNYALAYAAIAGIYIGAGDAFLSKREAAEKAKPAAARALELDDALVEAHMVLGEIAMYHDWNWSETENEYRRAIQLDPNNVDAHTRYSFYLALIQGRYPEALAEAEQALQIDPRSIGANRSLGNVYLFSRRYDEAIEQFQKTFEMDKSNWRGHFLLGITYLQKGEIPESIAEFEKGRQLGDYPLILKSLARAYAMSGNRAKAYEILDELKRLSAHQYISPPWVAGIYAALGERDKAFEWLEKGYEERADEMLFLNTFSYWDDYRSDPRFQDLVRRVGLPPKFDIEKR